MQPPSSNTRFEFETCLGAGGFGEVYLARMVQSSGLEQQVAVKTLHLNVALGSDSARRLRDEARLLAALNHRAILRIHDLVVLEGRLALVTEYVPGQDLDELVKPGPMPARVAVEITGEVAGALNAAWSSAAPSGDGPMGLVHRDIKPSNVRVSTSGGVKLLDFGIAVSSGVDREAKTGTGLVVGTVGYLAPERLTEEGAEPPSDIFALGCVLYELLSGKRLYADVTRRQLTRMSVDGHVHDAFITQALAGLAETTPESVVGLLRAALRHEPADRPTAIAFEAMCDDAGADLRGVHLRRWAREREWPPPQPGVGALDGRSISATGQLSAPTRRSGSVERASSFTPAPQPRASSDSPVVSKPTSQPTLMGELFDEEEVFFGANLGTAPETAALDGALTPLGGHAIPPVVPLAGLPPEEAPRSRRWRVAALIGLGLLAAAVTWSAWPSDGGDPPAVAAVTDDVKADRARGPSGRRDAPRPPNDVGVAQASYDPEPGVATASSEPVVASVRPSERPVAAPPPTAPPAPPPPPAADAGPDAGADAGSDVGADALPEVASEGAADADGGAGGTAPTTDASPTASVAFAGQVPTELRQGGQRFGAGDLRVGAYEIWADFGSGSRQVGERTFDDGERVRITCSKMVMNCRVEDL